MIMVLSIPITSVLARDFNIFVTGFSCKWKVFPDLLKNFHHPLTLKKYTRRC